MLNEILKDENILLKIVDKTIALQVFKEYWNELYNLVIADTVFERDISFASLEKTFDFWAESK